MDDGRTAALKLRLVNERIRLERELEDMRTSEGGGAAGITEAGGAWDATVSSHIADHATEVAQQETTIGLAYNLQSILDAVDSALHRMERGTYGQCESCGSAIPEARLEALPYATLCIACKTTLERRR